MKISSSIVIPSAVANTFNMDRPSLALRAAKGIPLGRTTPEGGPQRRGY
jgi:hypothetical protein